MTINNPYRVKQRKKLRLTGYDYSSKGYYFITICTRDRVDFFGDIIDGKMILNELGIIVYNEIIITSDMRGDIEMDEFIIMPNHIHLILIIVGCDGIAPMNSPTMNNIPTNNPQNKDNSQKINNEGDPKNMDNMLSGTMQSFPTVYRVIRGLKGSITSKINHIPELREGFGWQKSFFDKIIRNDEQLHKTRQYIIDNPKKWELDINNTVNTKNYDNK